MSSIMGMTVGGGREIGSGVFSGVRGVGRGGGHLPNCGRGLYLYSEWCQDQPRVVKSMVPILGLNQAVLWQVWTIEGMEYGWWNVMKDAQFLLATNFILMIIIFTYYIKQSFEFQSDLPF